MSNSLHKKYLLQGFLLWVIILLLGSLTEAQATHIRAGDITAKRDTTPNPNPRRFFFTMTIYRDTSSDVRDDVVNIDPGTGGALIEVPVASIVDIGNQTERWLYTWEYTYPADGTYTTSWIGVNRNPGILNITPPTDLVTFYISTTININALRGFNSTPVLTVAPIDVAAVGRVFVHNPGAYDADGDSLAFKLRVPQRQGGNGQITDVPGYSLPSLTFSCQSSDASGASYL
ncbi:gliding motility-associated C-terminal domain-containing protein, partial [Pontibacter silvestris]